MGDAEAGLTGHADAGQGGGDDAALIARSVRAPERFAALFDWHAPAIHRYLARRLGPDAADDLVAETFLVAFQRRQAYRAADAGASPWLYGFATNLIRRRRRDETRLLRAIAKNNAPDAAIGQVNGRPALVTGRGAVNFWRNGVLISIYSKPRRGCRRAYRARANWPVAARSGTRG